MSDSLVGVLELTLKTLNSIPDPLTGTVTGLLTEIWDAVMMAKQNRNQLRLLFRRVCIILQGLKIPQDYSDEAMRNSVATLQGNLQSILTFVRAEQKKSFLKVALTADDMRLKIEEQERLIWTACFAFQNAALVSQNVKLGDLWAMIDKQRKESAAHDAQQKAYLQDISDKLDQMRSATSNTQFLDALLDSINVDPMKQITAMRIVLDRDDSGSDGIRLTRDERAFFKAAVSRLSADSKAAGEINIKSWAVTSFEVDRGFLLGSDQTSRIRIGRWQGKLVGFLEVKDEEVVKRLVKKWKALRSPQIQTFMAASTIDEPPFILLPYLSDTIIEYVHKQAKAPNYVRLAHDMARGLAYLHGRYPPVIHGNLRPATVFVDAQGNAILTSIGLSIDDLAVPPDDAAELSSAVAAWHAPELRDGGAATEHSDIYSWGRIVEDMTTVLDELHRAPPFDGKELLQTLMGQAMQAEPGRRPSASDLVEKIMGVSAAAPDQGSSLFLTHDSMNGEGDGGRSIDAAMDRWRVVPCSRETQGVIVEAFDIMYLKTPPIFGKDEHPLRKLNFEIRCHDQGKENTSASPRDGTWTWVEVAIARRGPDGRAFEVNLEKALPGHYRGHMIDPTRHEVLRVPFADSTPRVHHIVLDHKHPLVKIVQRGDQILLYPKARYPGWQLHIYSAEIHAVMEC